MNGMALARMTVEAAGVWLAIAALWFGVALAIVEVWLIGKQKLR